MELIIRTDMLPAELVALRQLYESAFPMAERRPWSSVAMPTRMAGPHLHGIYSPDGAMLGMISTWMFPEFAYIEHLAIDERYRGSGIGAEVIALMLKRVGKPVVVEVEEPNESNPMTLRRVGFYERCGFKMFDTDYVQPPYGEGMPSVPMKLMIAPAESDIPKDVIEGTLHSRVYGLSA